MELKVEQISEMEERFKSSPKNIVAMNAVSNNPIQDVAMKREYLSKYNHVFSHEIKTMKATSQKHSGRCWMFAGMNVLRNLAAKKLNVEQFELSQSYGMFWDKLEKSNYFLENIIKTSNMDLHSREVDWLLNTCAGDGGQWGLLSNLVKKYGVVPKDVMKESFQTSNSKMMNLLLKTKLREDAMILRRTYAEGESETTLRAKKRKMMEEIYRFLAINIGIPPKRFDYEYRDKDGKYHRIFNITPLDFFKKFVGISLDDMVNVINCPTPDKKYMKAYTVRFLGNVIESKEIIYFNVSLDDFKSMTVKSIMDGNLVWFAADVGKMMEREKGILDSEAFDFENLYDFNFTFTKGERLNYDDSLITHAMVFTGVDIVNGKPTKWKVENSWGEKIGNEGYFVMGDKWFDEYVYEIVVDKSYLTDEMRKALKEKPIVLPPWDPMEAIARVKC